MKIVINYPNAGDERFNRLLAFLDCEEIRYSAKEESPCCTFCETPIEMSEIHHTEDGESCHLSCLQQYDKHWKDRDEALDFLGY